MLWPRRRKRPLSKTWVSKDWPLPTPSFGFRGRFTRFPPGLMRFSPISFLRFNCWQSPGYTEAKERGGKEKYHKKIRRLQQQQKRSQSQTHGGQCSLCSSRELLFVFPPAVTTFEQEVWNPCYWYKKSRTEPLFVFFFSVNTEPTKQREKLVFSSVNIHSGCVVLFLSAALRRALRNGCSKGQLIRNGCRMPQIQLVSLGSQEHCKNTYDFSKPLQFTASIYTHRWRRSQTFSTASTAMIR